jgi:TatD DNase family protein
MVGEMKDAGITGCVVNATREDDWDAVAALAREFPGFVFPAYGIHPWHADAARESWEERLRERLLSDPMSSVGEVGVDGWVDSPEIGFC